MEIFHRKRNAKTHQEIQAQCRFEVPKKSINKTSLQIHVSETAIIRFNPPIRKSVQERYKDFPLSGKLVFFKYSLIMQNIFT